MIDEFRLFFVDVRIARAEVVFLGASGGSKSDNLLLFKRK
jgi:hypothetical protein